jgi:hypothetical protein
VAGTTLEGVTLPRSSRRRGGDTFDVVLTGAGIEIERHGQAAYHLSWEHISEWEIEQRRGGVRLTFWGGGAATPLIVPRWSVDDLDAALRDAARPVSLPDPSEGADASD